MSRKYGALFSPLNSHSTGWQRYGTTWPIATIFLTNGCLFGGWVARIPEVKTRLALSDAELGGALFGIAAGVFIAMPIVGRAANRIDVRALISVAVCGYCITFPLLALAPDLWWLTIALVVFGSTLGALDVSMNVYASKLEQATSRSLLPGLHGAFSLGLLVGSGVGAVAATWEISPRIQFLAMSATFLAFCRPAGRALKSFAVELNPIKSLAETRGRRSSHSGRRAGDLRRLFMISAVAFAAALVEGAVADWSGVYLAEELASGYGRSAVGFVAFSVAMVTMRLVGGRLVRQFGARRIALGGGLLATIGMAIIVGGDDFWPAVFAFGAVGVGVAMLFPLCLSTAGAIPSVRQGTGISAVSTIGYLAFLAGPPCIGFIAHKSTIKGGLSVALAGAVVIACLARAVEISESELSPACQREGIRQMKVFPQEFAQAYNTRWGVFAEYIGPKIVKFYEGQDEAGDKTMLDLCCGTGQLSRIFLQHGYDVTGLDLSEAMLDYARKNAAAYGGERARFFAGSAAGYVLDHRVGLAVASGEALNHLRSTGDFKRCLDSTFAVLAEGGVFAFDVRTRKGFFEWNNITVEESDDGVVVKNGIYDGGDAATQRVLGFDRIAGDSYQRFEQIVHNVVYPIDWLEARVREAGWGEVRITSIQDPIPLR
jgi:MFS family permease